MKTTNAIKFVNGVDVVTQYHDKTPHTMSMNAVGERKQLVEVYRASNAMISAMHAATLRDNGFSMSRKIVIDGINTVVYANLVPTSKVSTVKRALSILMCDSTFSLKVS